MKAIITGGAGFIGVNLADRLIGQGDEVILVDNLSRLGAKQNYEYLLNKYRDKFVFSLIDLKYASPIEQLIEANQDVDVIYHLAAQSIPEHIYLAVQSTPKTGTQMLTFGEFWKRELRKIKPIITENGEVIQFRGDQVKALAFLNGGQWLPIRKIYRHRYNGKIIKLNQKWGVVEATPNHSIYSSNLELSTPINNPELLAIRNLNLVQRRKKQVDKRLLEILADYITEGSATSPSTSYRNKRNGRRGYSISFSQKDKEWLKNIQNLLKQIWGIKSWISPAGIKRPNCWRLEFSNKKYFKYLTENCGRGSTNKYFPNWIFDLKSDLQEFFWQKLLEGDGSDDGRYTTTSYRLANQISLLMILLNKKFTVHEATPSNPKHSRYWRFKTGCPIHSGVTKKNKTEFDYDGWVYDLELESSHNFACGIGNIVCHNTAVTISVENPRLDFNSNVVGTFNVLEAVREIGINPAIVFSSTNKTYGALEQYEIIEHDKYYGIVGIENGVTEEQPLDGHSAYGCSKLAGDQYVRDYARIYGLNTVVIRQGPIAGEHQFGIEDQGWVSYFIIQGMLGNPVTIYGTGKQVRDILHVDDLIDLYQLCISAMPKTRGEIFNAGGGIENSCSIYQFLEYLDVKKGLKSELSWDDWRLGDQKFYVTDYTKANKMLGWKPKISKEETVDRMIKWLEPNLDMIVATFKNEGG